MKKKPLRGVLVKSAGKTQREIVEAMVRQLRKAGMLKETDRSRAIK